MHCHDVQYVSKDLVFVESGRSDECYPALRRIEKKKEGNITGSADSRIPYSTRSRISHMPWLCLPHLKRHRNLLAPRMPHRDTQQHYVAPGKHYYNF